MSSLLKYLQFKNTYNEEYEKSSNLHIFHGNYVLSAFLLTFNSTLLLYLFLIYFFESNDEFKVLISKMILSGFLSLFFTSLNWFIVYLITVPSDSYIPRILEEKFFKYIEKKNFCVYTNCLMTVPFQIIYYLCKEYYTNHSDLIFLFMGIEYILRYLLTINFYYSYSVIIVASSLTTLFIHSLFFQNLYPLLTLQYSSNFIFSALFAYIYEKYLKYRFLDNNVQKNERSFLTEVIDKMQCAYLLTDKANILYRNKAFDLFLSETKDIISSMYFRRDMCDTGRINIYIDSNENVKEMIETLFGNAESHEYFDYDINIEIVNFFVEELQNCGNTDELEHSFTNSFYEFNKLNRNLLGNIQSPRDNNFDNDQMKIKLNLPLLSEESDEESHFNPNSNRRKIKQSLFKKKEENFLSKGGKDSGREKYKKKISLYKLHDFLSRFKDEFKDFTRLATIPIETQNETKFLEVILKISDIFEDNKLKYEYVINDVTKIKASDLLKKEIKFKSLFLAKIAHEIKNPIITISNLCQTLNSKVTQINSFHNTTYVSSDEDSEDERNNNLNRRGSYLNVSSIQETSSFIVSTGNYMMSLIEDLNYFSKMEQQNKNLSDIPQINSHLEEFTEFEVKPVLEFCLTIFRLRQKIDENKKGVRILSDYDKRIPDKLISSEVKLKQILINLLSNAYKFTIFGNIKLIARAIEKEQKNFIHFEVSDTGTGIPHDQIQNLCNPFSLTSKNQSLNQHGSGLGLFIVKDLLKKLNTTLIINSIEGKGSTFAFDIEYKPKKRESILFDEKASMKTLKHYPVMTDSLKNFYTLFNVKNIHESSENIDESFSKLGSMKSKFESRDSFNRFKMLEKTAKTKITLKDFYKFCDSKKNIDELSSNSEKSYKIQITSSDMSFQNDIISDSSKRNVVRGKYSSVVKDERSRTPNISSRKRMNESRKKLNEIAEENEVKSVLKIMICEDDYGIRNTIKRLFIRVSEEKKISIELEESINGIECIYRIYKDYINGTKYDSVLLDENMPFMKGSNCMTILKNMYTEGSLNRIKIISISSFDDQETMKFIKSQGCDEFIPKPHTKEVVSKFLDSLVT